MSPAFELRLVKRISNLEISKPSGCPNETHLRDIYKRSLPSGLCTGLLCISKPPKPRCLTDQPFTGLQQAPEPAQEANKGRKNREATPCQLHKS